MQKVIQVGFDRSLIYLSDSDGIMNAPTEALLVCREPERYRLADRLLNISLLIGIKTSRDEISQE